MWQLINSDLFDLTIPKCKLLLTDIPYGAVSRDSNGLRDLDKGKADVLEFDIISFLEHIWESADIFVIFCGNEQYGEIYTWFANKSKLKLGTTRQIVWSKTNPSPMNCEYVLLNATENAVWFKKKGTGKLPNKYVHNVYSFPTGSSKWHPTEKNHQLLKKIIEDNTYCGDLVVDVCVGSGSTGIVSIQNGRNFWGCEIDKHYFDIAESRLDKVSNK